MGEKNPKILGFGGVIGAGADALQFSDAPMYYLKEEPKCEIVTDPNAETFTADLPAWRPGGFTLTGTGTVTMDEGAMSDIARQLHEADCVVHIEPSDLHLPRKMKKALRNGWLYKRDTKWKRKAERWQERNEIKILGRISQEGDTFTITGKRTDPR